MRPCPCRKGNKKSWKYRFNDETRKITATCRKCGSIVEFKAKPRKALDPNKIEACANYEIRDGKRFLEINGKFKEVDIFKVDKKGKIDPYGNFLRVMPV